MKKSEFQFTDPHIVNLEFSVNEDFDEAKFKTEQKTSPEFFAKLLNANAPALLMSYARPIIAVVTARAGFPSFNIPFINFMES